MPMHEFEARLKAKLAELPFLSADGTVAVAVSGGLDSMALAACLRQLKNPSIIALTVDHGLRPAAGAEARQVALWMQTLGIEHHILTGHCDAHESNLQNAARNLRYALMHEFCEHQHIQSLMLAHHLDDQAETMLMRLARGSGLKGLAAMEVVSYHQDLRLIRPLLEFPRKMLKDYLTAIGQGWIEDPSNHHHHYDRTKIRTALGQLGTEQSLLNARLGKTAAYLSDAAHELSEHDVAWISDHIQMIGGIISIPAEAFMALPQRAQIEILHASFSKILHAPHEVRSSSCLNLIENLQNDGARLTLAKMMIERKKNSIFIAPEPSKAPTSPKLHLTDIYPDCEENMRSDDFFYIGQLGQFLPSKLKQRLKKQFQQDVPVGIPLQGMTCVIESKLLADLDHVTLDRESISLHIDHIVISRLPAPHLVASKHAGKALAAKTLAW